MDNPGDRRRETHAESLAHEVLTSDRTGLSAAERLFVVSKAMPQDYPYERARADLLVRAGCFTEARAVFERIGHRRKLGDLAWAEQDLDAAKTYYLMPEDADGDVYRAGPDWDRLIRLAACRGAWDEVATLIAEAPFRDVGLSKQVVLGSSACAVGPYLDLAALARKHADKDSKLPVPEVLALRFGVGVRDIEQRDAVVGTWGEEVVARLTRRLPPRIARLAHVSLDQALQAGRSPRAEGMLADILSIDERIRSATTCAVSFLETGAPAHLRLVPAAVAAFKSEFIGVRVAQTVIDQALSDAGKSTPSRVAALLASHEYFALRYHAVLTRCLIESGQAIDGRHLYRSLLKRAWLIEDPVGGPGARLCLRKRLTEIPLAANRLRAHPDWTRSACDRWIESRRSEELRSFKESWRSKELVTDSRLCSWGDGEEGPVATREWHALLLACHSWVADRWREEIGAERWKAEAIVFETLRRKLRGYDVERHAQPPWLAPQHLDVFVPQLSLAVEYMGRQHDEPVEFFGGEESLARTKERDERKRDACRAAGIHLEYVREGDDMEAACAAIVTNSLARFLS